jgi:hydroxymethylbilane synthase
MQQHRAIQGRLPGHGAMQPTVDLPMNTPPLRLGTRASPLARWQAEWVAAQLAQHGVAVVLVPITTAGDRDQRGAVAQIGGQGLFTKEIQRAVLQQEADLAVHSLKDLPTEAVPGLVLAAVPPRAACGDVLVCRTAARLDSLPQGAIVGTGSIRRRAQLWHVRPDLQMRDIRGNVDTRLRKLSDGQFDALVLAEAGLTRLQLGDRITQRLPLDVMLPAVGQGALGVECRADDSVALSAVRWLDDPPSHACVLAERALLAALRAGCLAPVGARARLDGDVLRLDAAVLSPDGRQRLHQCGEGPPHDPESLGRQVAETLLARGAAQLIRAAHAAPE